MHPYATDSSERRTVMAVLMISSILLAYSLGWLVGTIQNMLKISLWWLDAPAVFGFYGILFTIFNRWLLRVRLLHTLNVIKVPDLNGTWTGEALSSHQEFATAHAVTVKIHQTWTAVCISLSGQHSDSESVVAAILFPKPDSVVLTYQYTNEPHAKSDSSMHAHRGTTWLYLRHEQGVACLEGDYYSGRDRRNIGHMKLSRRGRLEKRTAEGGE
jgi:phosphotransferase system  glucose/maltose/N-acetylglucosamine-specific IIC component